MGQMEGMGEMKKVEVMELTKKIDDLTIHIPVPSPPLLSFLFIYSLFYPEDHGRNKNFERTKIVREGKIGAVFV